MAKSGESAARSRAREMLLKAILRNPGESLLRAPLEVQRNKEFLLEAVEQNATVLEYCRELRNDKDFALRAVAVNGRSLWHLPQHLQQDAEVIVAAVAKHGAALGGRGDASSSDASSSSSDAAPGVTYAMKLLRSSRTAVQEIRDECDAEKEAQRVAFERKEDRMRAEIAALTAKMHLVKLDNTTDFIWDSVKHSEELCTHALHLETLRVNALQTKINDLARLAVDAGADEHTVFKIKSKPLRTTTVSGCC
mmetsp:Transcript_12472/g.40801  ORF Transcript_12472/g.40801 Transcript_12472/m.40801 type:complete len:251 (+) Transcript_12472:1495-2247(+)|eukprot:CAMPEP_0118919608 /NCGR_PEP_ID=MMETSP1166-20130328/18645_1 /TAXON_ID=1104430 /ORGANISM="Chrysoreinhardia sp, Strain CCMP3193" /LENGTH=250 /DNA_ID=CAMNT_0006860139 /DNA_START=70 /DNA_END=822 /DNA_ORIENTATION=+